MNNRQRVINSLSHQSSDSIPYHVEFTMEEHKKMVSFLKDEQYLLKINNHLHRTYWNNINEESIDKPGNFKDFFGVTWNRSGVDKDIGIIDDPLFKEANITMVDFPVLNSSIAYNHISDSLIGKKENFVIGDIGFSLFERAWSMRGFENLLMDMALNPEFVHQLLDKICEFNISVIELYGKFTNIDGFYFGDDWGQQHGLIMGPAMWREFILPRLKKMYATCQKHGFYIMQHSCGDIEEIFPDLLDAGLNCYNTFQPEIYDIKKIKKQFGGQLSFWGAISTQALLPFESPKVVYEETKRIMSILGEDGGYIAAPTHALPYDVPCENVIAMLKAFEE